MTNADDWIDTLKAIAQELTWTSEIDAPMDVVVWQIAPSATLSESAYPLTLEQLRRLTGHEPSETVEVVEFDAFFSSAIAEQDWFGDAEKAIAAQYRSLVALMKRHLQDLRVYRVGTVRVDVYVLGRPVEMQGSASTPTIIGLATQAVET